MQRLVTQTRHTDVCQLGLSPRGALALVKCAQSRAMIEGRDYVLPEDVQQVFVAVAGHRIIGRTENHGDQLAAQVAVMLPFMVYLPIWLMLVLLLCTAWKLRVLRGFWAQPSWLFKGVVLALGLLALGISGLSPLSLDTMSSLLLLAFTLITSMDPQDFIGLKPRTMMNLPS